MSRSRRHSPVFATTCCKSEKKDKRMLHSKLRAMAKVQLLKESDDYIDPMPEEAMNVWSMGKDGKGYRTISEREFCPELFEQMMRK